MTEHWKILNTRNKHLGFNEESENHWTGSFYFVQGADCQLGLIERYILKLPNPSWQKEITLTKLAIEKINSLQPKPKFFVICGDLCDAFPVTEADTRAKQEADLKEILLQLDPEIPLVCVCGNHDVGDKPTVASIQQYKSSFGDDYYSFWCGGVLCIVVNSQLWMDCSDVPEQAAAQDSWLEGQLKEAKSRNAKMLIFQHIPWFLKSASEPAIPYFALPPDVRNVWLPKFQQAGVEAVFCGHYHRNTEGNFEGMPVVTTSAIGGQLGDDKSGLRIVKVLSSGVSHKYYSFEEFPTKVELD